MSDEKMTDHMAVLLRAKYPIIGVLSREEGRVEKALTRLERDLNLKVVAWSRTQGVLAGIRHDDVALHGAQNLGQALDYVLKMDQRALVILRDVHHYMDDPYTLRRLRDCAKQLRETPTESARWLVLLSPVLSIPQELQSVVHVVDWPLPGRPEVERILNVITSSVQPEVQKQAEIGLKANREQVVAAALGLTSDEVYSALSRSLVELRRFDPAMILQEKKQIVEQSGILEWMDALPNGLAGVGGLEEFKAWMKLRQRAMSPKARLKKIPLPKGVFLAGMPGCGKTMLAQAVAGELGLPVIKINVGAIFSSGLGDSERNIRLVLQLCRVLAPCVLLVDELDKSAGAEGGEKDGGTSGRVKAELLGFLQDRASAEMIFVVGTANNVEELSLTQPELIRKGRWDEQFFVDLPNGLEREQILAVQLARYGVKVTLKPKQWAELVQASAGFSGVELEAVVVDSMFAAFADDERDVEFTDLLLEIQRTVPMSKSSKERIDGLRKWAEGRARNASRKAVAASLGVKIEV